MSQPMPREMPDEAEMVAAVVALIAARAGVAAPADEPPALWRDHTALVRAPLLPGPGSWRASALPR